MQIIPESGMSLQFWFKAKRYLTKYTQQGKIAKNCSIQISQWTKALVERLKWGLIKPLNNFLNVYFDALIFETTFTEGKVLIQP